MEIWMRYKVLPKIQEKMRFEIDEALGGTKAALTARMTFLQMHLKQWKLIETSPKLTIAVLSSKLKLPPQVLSTYRHLEKGIHSRSLIIEGLAQEFGIFIYEKENKRLCNHLGSFYAFLSALTVLLADEKKTVSPPKNFPDKMGWTAFPKT